MKSTTNARHGVAVHGSTLGAEIRSLLLSLGYTLVAVAEAVAYIDQNGTATGSDTIDPADVAGLDKLIRHHTGNTEYVSASEWPGVWDDAVWVLTDDDEPAPADEPFHPSPEDRAQAASLLDADPCPLPMDPPFSDDELARIEREDVEAHARPRAIPGLPVRPSVRLRAAH